MSEPAPSPGLAALAEALGLSAQGKTDAQLGDQIGRIIFDVMRGSLLRRSPEPGTQFMHPDLGEVETCSVDIQSLTVPLLQLNGGRMTTYPLLQVIAWIKESAQATPRNSTKQGR